MEEKAFHTGYNLDYCNCGSESLSISGLLQMMEDIFWIPVFHISNISRLCLGCVVLWWIFVLLNNRRHHPCLLFWLRTVGGATKMKVMKRFVLAVPSCAIILLSFQPYVAAVLGLWVPAMMVAFVMIGSSKWGCMDSKSGADHCQYCFKWKQEHSGWQETNWGT